MAEFRVRPLSPSPSPSPSLPSRSRPPFFVLYSQAAEDALHRLYLTRTPPHLLRLPTSTFPAPPERAEDPLARADVFVAPAHAEAPYVPGELGESEVPTGSAGRSAIKMSPAAVAAR